MSVEFQSFQKIGRFRRNILITEKIDGTNGQIYIGDDGTFLVGSRNRWITQNVDGGKTDNAGFAQWAHDNKEELMKLGPGRHYGEWWGHGIQRGYGLTEKKFSLFNYGRWSNPENNKPSCCDVVPALYQGQFTTEAVDSAMEKLRVGGSVAAPGFMSPEGIVILHSASGTLLKRTIENDDIPKSLTLEGVLA